MELSDQQTYNWEAVESSAVRALCFVERGIIEPRTPHAASDTHAYGEVFVCFHSGDVYRYYPVLECAFEVLRDADSIGREMYHVLVPGTGAKVGRLPDDTTNKEQ